MLTVATLIAYAIYVYLGLGLVYALYFAFRATRAVPIKGVLTRLMLIPGAMLIWPLLLMRRPSA